ncbi:MAG: amidohydrolase [Deltaproteobacteria bacterium]|jgi:predicted amidohydrolase YtcJ|nr:amidohydrolase [Deltaproteobacteria bacterium]
MADDAKAGIVPGRLFLNGDIRTMDQSVPRATCMASYEGRISYLGDRPEEAHASLVRELGGGDAVDAMIERTDLLKRTVIPGLTDSHSHAIGEGLRLTQLDLSGLGYEELLEKVRAKAEGLPEGAWLHGRGWDNNLWKGSPWPHRKDLDRVAPKNPVALDRLDKHSLWLNTLALGLSGLDSRSQAPEGGEIIRDPDGSPSGVLLGPAMRAAWLAMPQNDGFDREGLFLRAQSELLSLGLTTLIDCGTRLADFGMLTGLLSQGRLKARVRVNVIGDPWEPGLLDGDRPKSTDPGKLAIDGIKLFSDGSLGSRSAWLSQEYYDSPGHFGNHNYDDGRLLKLFEKARDRDLQVAIHVIGDRAIGQAVDMMGKALGSESRERRFRLEHFQVTDKGILRKTASLGLIPSIQSVGLMYDLRMAPLRLGPQRIRDCYAWRRILDGGFLINGSDAPVESPNPFHGIYAAVSRRDLSGYPEEGFQPRDALTLEEALLSYTRWSADAAFRQKDQGTLSIGKLCDLVVLDRDIFSVGLRDIADTVPLMTVVGGETVFADPAAFPDALPEPPLP